MAEDLMIGFKFYDREDNMDKDMDVWQASDALFNEAAFDHLGGAAKETQKVESETVERFDEMENFDFTEGFDFIM